MTWMWRLHLIVPEAERDAANQLAVSIGPGWAEVETFSVPLSTDGGASITHYGCNTLATEAMRVSMFANAQPGWWWWLLDAASAALIGWHADPPPTGVLQPVATNWNWMRSLDSVGLAPWEPAE